MIVDFSALNLKERQVLLLKNLDDTVICPLMTAHKLQGKFNLLDVSEITFEVPAKTYGYNFLTGMRVIDWIGIGQFLLMNPEENDDGAVRYKNCKAYSLEYELSYKQTYIAEGTHNLRDVMDMVLADVPSWSIGRFDASLLDKYRTFDATKENTYDFLRGTVQELYGVLFDFDTYNRKINVIDADAFVATKPVYIALQNLAKEIKVEENTEKIYTCLDVNGADGVDIRSVNPLGSNVIYNLDYYMTTDYFTADIIEKWNAWKDRYESFRRPYFNATVRRSLQEANLIAEQANLTNLQGQKSAKEELQGFYAEVESKGFDESENLKTVKQEIAALDLKIAESEELIASIKTDIAALGTELSVMKNSCSFFKFFTEDEIVLLDRYFKVNTLTEESFVYTDVVSYAAEDLFSERQDINFSISGADISCVKSESEEMYMVAGGNLTMTVDQFLDTEETTKAPVSRASFQKDADGQYLFTAELGGGTMGATEFKRGCISLIGNDFVYHGGLTEDDEIDGYYTGVSCTVTAGVSRLCFTQNTTEFTKRAVEWDLLEYGESELQKVAYPRYQFSVDSANFFAADEFEAFKNQFALGTKCYLKIGDRVLTPIAIGAELSVEDLDSLSIQFSDEYSAFDTAFKLADLLSQSVSMGKSFAAAKASINLFQSSDAADVMHQWLTKPLDMAKNAILSTSGQAIQIDGSGIRLRKYIDPSNPALGFEDKQIWMSNNSIVFTKDNWDSAEMAIGEFVDDYLGRHYGIRGPAIVGTLLASSVLNVRSSKEHGGIAEFLVDGDGARLLNSKFTLANEYDTGMLDAIILDPAIGIVAGSSSASIPMLNWNDDQTVYGVTTGDGDVIQSIKDLDSGDEPNANFWVDMNGDVYMRGTVMAESGKFSGIVQATDFINGAGESMLTAGKFKSEYLDLEDVYVEISTSDDALKMKISDLDGNVAELEASAKELTTRVSDNEDNISNVSQRADAISSSVQDLEAGLSTTLKVAADGVTITSQDGETVTISGSQIDATTINAKDLNLTGTLSFSSFSDAGVAELNGRYQSRFSVDGVTNWHSTMTASDMYRCDSYDGGQTWGAAYKFRGQDGSDGSDANVSWKNIKAALQKADGVEDSFITADEAGFPRIYGGEIYGANIYAGDGSSEYYSQMNDDGFTIWYEGDVKARMYSEGEDTGNPTVGIDLGRGTVQDGAGAWEGAGIFHLYKDSDTAYVIYNTPTNEEVGFVFNDDATITVKGTLNGMTGEGAVAVFG